MKARDRGKPPKPIADLEVWNIIHDVLNQHLKKYPTTVEVRRLCDMFLVCSLDVSGI